MKRLRNSKVINFIEEFLTILIWFTICAQLTDILNLIGIGGFTPKYFVKVISLVFITVMWYFVWKMEDTDKKISHLENSNEEKEEIQEIQEDVTDE